MQTAIEYLFEEFFKVKWDCMQGNKPIIFEQAKAMEKEQIENTFADGFVEGVETQKSGKQLLFPEQYYNQTYNQNK